jgi:integrase
VVTVSAEDVGRMLDACETWQEYLCLTTAVYLGARRRALARVCRRDVDLENGTIRFVEKGPKIITKPLPDEYAQILWAAQAAGIWKSDDAYLIPNPRPGAVKRGERSGDHQEDRCASWCTGRALSRSACSVRGSVR